MRYQKAENTYLVAAFSTGKTITITIYQLSDSSVIVNAAMTEIGSTGMFKYLAALAPIVATEYLWIASDGYDQRAGKIVMGGYPDTLATSQAAEEASIATISGNVATIQADETTIKGSQTTAAGNIATILSDIASILASQSGEEGDIDTITGNIATILSDIASILSSQSGEEGDIDSIQADVAEIKASQADEKSDIAAILSRVPERGAGATAKTYTLLDSDDDPISDADIWVSTDDAGENVIASGTTDQNGQVTFYLDVGTVYIWRAKTGYSFTNPDEELVE